MRVEERRHGITMAGALAHLLDGVAKQLHANESIHLHDGSVDVADCGYCYLRAGRTLGVIALHYPEVAERAVPPGAVRDVVASPTV